MADTWSTAARLHRAVVAARGHDEHGALLPLALAWEAVRAAARPDEEPAAAVLELAAGVQQRAGDLPVGDAATRLLHALTMCLHELGAPQRAAAVTAERRRRLEEHGAFTGWAAASVLICQARLLRAAPIRDDAARERLAGTVTAAARQAPRPADRPWQRTVRRDLAATVAGVFTAQVWDGGHPDLLRRFYRDVTPHLDSTDWPRNIHSLLNRVEQLSRPSGIGR